MSDFDTDTERLDEIRRLARFILDYKADPITIAAHILSVCGNEGCMSGQPILINYKHTGHDHGPSKKEPTTLLAMPMDIWWGHSEYHFGYQWFIRARNEQVERDHVWGQKIVRDIRDIALLDITSITREPSNAKERGSQGTPAALQMQEYDPDLGSAAKKR